MAWLLDIKGYFASKLFVSNHQPLRKWTITIFFFLIMLRECSRKTKGHFMCPIPIRWNSPWPETLKKKKSKRRERCKTKRKVKAVSQTQKTAKEYCWWILWIVSFFFHDLLFLLFLFTSLENNLLMLFVFFKQLIVGFCGSSVLCFISDLLLSLVWLLFSPLYLLCPYYSF